MERLKFFDELSVEELYDILQLREDVFQIEQNCIYQDIDNKDKSAYHLMRYEGDKLVGYSRILAKGISYSNYCSIGRVCTAFDFRQKNYGKIIMKKSIEICQKLFPNTDIKISAQSYLLRFYSELGFKAIGDEYLEDNIPHKAMVYSFLTEN